MGIDDNFIHDNSIPKRISLVKYKNPSRVTVFDTETDKILKKHKRSKTDGSIKSLKKQPVARSRVVEETEEILNSIISPHRYITNGNIFMQEISSSPATKEDIYHLMLDLDTQLQNRQAKSTGICPIRRELYDELFNELIRQITINCAERGLLLINIRNELNLSMQAYKTLHTSGVVYGLEKSLKMEQGLHEYSALVAELNCQIACLNKKIELEELNCQTAQERANEKLKSFMKKAKDDVNFLDKNRQELKKQLLNAIDPNKNELLE